MRSIAEHVSAAPPPVGNLTRRYRDTAVEPRCSGTARPRE
ncbi:hypothetical protein EBESD8_10880 [Rhodococcus aetherivorans]|nr:hypothetical protein EBESD8_10880 [Rhodococcus aetherivorans]